MSESVIGPCINFNPAAKDETETRGGTRAATDGSVCRGWGSQALRAHRARPPLQGVNASFRGAGSTGKCKRGRLMNKRQLFGIVVGAFLCLMTTACFSIEQELFLNQDGSGEMALHVSLPDFPEDMMKSDKTGNKNPVDDIANMKKDFVSSLPPTVKLKEVKEVKQNGSLGFYLVFQFKDVNDLASVFDTFNKGSLKDGDIQGKSKWTSSVVRIGDKSQYTGTVLVDLADKNPAAGSTSGPKNGAKEGSKESAADGSLDDLSKQLEPLLLGTVRLRFVLHAPTPITDTNADIVLNRRIAVWNCSLIAFSKDKKPIVMKATY
jgi:hypothetical protein